MNVCEQTPSCIKIPLNQTLQVLKVVNLVSYINPFQILLAECISVQGTKSASLSFIWFFFFLAVSQF